MVLDAAGVAVLGTGDGGALVFTTEEELSGAGEGYSQVKHDSSKSMKIPEGKQVTENEMTMTCGDSRERQEMEDSTRSTINASEKRRGCY